MVLMDFKSFVNVKCSPYFGGDLYLDMVYINTCHMTISRDSLTS